MASELRGEACGFDLRLGRAPFAGDPVPIRWHQAGGPEREHNGLMLRVLHHKMFDLDAFTVRELAVWVSDQANGSTGFREPLMACRDRPIRDPHHPDGRPESEAPRMARVGGLKGRARHRD